jgi:L-amino acid N-acyltransferase YncA
MIRLATPADAAAIAEIYNPYVLDTHVTFEEEIVSPEQMLTRLTEIQSAYPYLVHEQDGIIAGYAYANKWHTRCSYRRSVETSVYLDKSRTGKGIGSELYGELIRFLKNAGFHTAIGGIALPNEASIALHEKLGFTKAAHYREVGWKFNRWIDVGYWQLML